MTDESIINLSDETKSSLRIYATMAGFFILFAITLYSLVSYSSGQFDNLSTVMMFGSAMVLIIGTILALLHKRDLFAAFFILIALFEFFNGISPSEKHVSIALALVIAMLAFIQTPNEQRYIVGGILFLHVLSYLLSFLGVHDVVYVVRGIYMIGYLYFALALACERIKLPLRDMLVADEETPENDGSPVHFKVMGSSIGYLMLAMFMGYVVMKSFDFGTGINPTSLEGLMVAMGVIFLIIGAIMMVAGRMRGTPFYFVCSGFLFLMLSAGVSWIPGLCFVILGMMIMLREDSRILLGSGYILMGLSFMVIVSTHQFMIGGIFATIAFLIFTYLTFAVNSNGKLKLI